MKKLLVLIGVLLCSSAAHAVESVWQSSTTATAESIKMLCGANRRRATVYAVVVSSAANGHVQLYNSSFTATNVTGVGPIVTTPVQRQEYRTTFPNGLSYTKAGPAVVTILYECN